MAHEVRYTLDMSAEEVSSLHVSGSMTLGIWQVIGSPGGGVIANELELALTTIEKLIPGHETEIREQREQGIREAVQFFGRSLKMKGD